MNPVRHQISRYGAYAIIVRGGECLLVKHTSGPFVGKWGLPGGRIEFGESPEEALVRELREEAALKATAYSLLRIDTTTGTFEKGEETYDYHHVGIIYEVDEVTPIPGVVPEDEARWFPLSSLKEGELASFAKVLLEYL